MKKTLIVIASIFLVFVAIFALNYLALGRYKFFAPKFENVRREVFQNTRSYNEGKIQDLAKYRIEYLMADQEDKVPLKITILFMFADYPKDRLPHELKLFIKDLESSF